MPSPFPGMDPYLENPELWPEVHSRLIVAIADAIAPVLLPNYYAAIEKRYLEVRDSQSGQVITILELLSPKNKRAGEGREAYLRKRQQILTSLTHWVEIDLLRSGKPMPMQGATQQKDYRILVSPSNSRPRAQLYAFTVRDTIPQFQLPLKAEDSAPIVALKPILDGVYDRGGYQFRLDYRQQSVPPLPAAETAWVREQLGEPSVED